MNSSICFGPASGPLLPAMSSWTDRKSTCTLERDPFQHLEGRVADGIENIVDQLGLLVEGEADVLLAKKLAWLVEATRNADGNHPPGFAVGVGPGLPILCRSGPH